MIKANKSLLKTHVVAFNKNLEIVSAVSKSLRGLNFKSLFAENCGELADRILHMRLSSVIKEEYILDLGSGAKRYALVIRRGANLFTAVIIELEEIHQLIENEALYKQYAFTDSLTGALTRHGYWNKLFELLKSADDLEENIGIIFADIDNLKLMNTQYGYTGGDKQIAEVSATIASSLRKRDVLVRIGGDEFLVLLPLRMNSPDLVTTVAKRITSSVHKNPNLKTTVSIGTYFLTTKEISKILESPDIPEAWEVFIEKVDEKLKIAKSSGKDKIV